jgi:hypothetical protein
MCGRVVGSVEEETPEEERFEFRTDLKKVKVQKTD